MRVLLDTNVVLDALLDRQPWAPSASILWDASHNGVIDCCITASAMTDLYYIARGHVRRLGLVHIDARRVVRDSLDSLDVIRVDGVDLERAFAIGGVDFEDDLQIACAEREQLDAIVTRDPSGFSKSSIPIFSTSGFVDRLVELGILEADDGGLPPELGPLAESGEET